MLVLLLRLMIQDDQLSRADPFAPLAVIDERCDALSLLVPAKIV
jgi:hypothetical protein